MSGRVESAHLLDHSVADGAVFVEHGAVDVEGDEPRGVPGSTGEVGIRRTAGDLHITGSGASGMSGTQQRRTVHGSDSLLSAPRAEQQLRSEADER